MAGEAGRKVGLSSYKNHTPQIGTGLLKFPRGWIHFLSQTHLKKLQLSDLAANRAVMVRLIIYPDLSAKAPPLFVSNSDFGGVFGV